jgi:D-sedoheptulose 7-phosphate isomerase
VGVAGATSPDRVALRLERAIAARREAGSTMFERESPRIAACCHRMAQRFASGGRLISLGADPAARSDARHVSVEFVHPVIVGKRALPATALTGEGGPLAAQLEAAIGSDDIVVGFGLGAESAAAAETAAALAVASDLGCMTIAFGPGARADRDRHWLFEPPSADPAIRQELVETVYHVLWELVHVFFEHRGLLAGLDGEAPGRSAAGFLYPFLEEGDADLDAVLSDVTASVRMKSEEVGELRAQTLRENSTELATAAETIRACFDAGGRLLAFGNGGSATDAMDLVADLRLPEVAGWRSWPALDLTEDTPIITAVANDVGVAEIFQRQLIASGREGDVAVAFSTSGGSENLIEGLAEARRRGIGTVAFVGYDGGRIAAEGLADAMIISRSQHIPRIQEAQASGYHLLRELVERADARGVPG